MWSDTKPRSVILYVKESMRGWCCLILVAHFPLENLKTKRLVYSVCTVGTLHDKVIAFQLLTRWEKPFPMLPAFEKKETEITTMFVQVAERENPCLPCTTSEQLLCVRDLDSSPRWSFTFADLASHLHSNRWSGRKLERADAYFWIGTEAYDGPITAKNIQGEIHRCTRIGCPPQEKYVFQEAAL